MDSLLLVRRAGESLSRSQRRLEQSDRRITATLTLLLEAAWSGAPADHRSPDQAGAATFTAAATRTTPRLAPPLVHQ